MCNNYVNSNKLCYLPPDIYLGIVYVPDHPVYLVKLVTPTWKHPLWCDDLHLYVVYVCFTTQGRLFCFPKPYFPIRRAHHFRNILSKCTILLPVTQKWTVIFGCIPCWRKKSLIIVFRTSTWLGKTNRSMATFCIPSVIKANHTREWHLVQWLLPVSGWITIISSWVFLIKGITIVSINHVVKIWVEGMISYYNLPMFIYLLVSVPILSEVVTLHKLGQPIIWWLDFSIFIT